MSRHHRERGEAKGPAWERQRRAVFDRDRWRCQVCGRPGKLEAHHVVEIAHGGTNDQGNLRTLCRACHIEHHRPEESLTSGEWQSLMREL